MILHGLYFFRHGITNIYFFVYVLPSTLGDWLQDILYTCFLKTVIVQKVPYVENVEPFKFPVPKFIKCLFLATSEISRKECARGLREEEHHLHGFVEIEQLVLTPLEFADYR